MTPYESLIERKLASLTKVIRKTYWTLMARMVYSVTLAFIGVVTLFSGLWFLLAEVLWALFVGDVELETTLWWTLIASILVYTGRQLAVMAKGLLDRLRKDLEAYRKKVTEIAEDLDKRIKVQ